ncbi:hypothetical protein BpHYR1_033143 [Brachionus plicatilis]|uniref:Uncharacterized protein n=1 Tax=Brachionus plicatilis TaxID=10195 RepID=A0A3M7QL25_BRAPC|nr:hypothetical protein BpHYR1_033143 [Brachionus plicatilis]
MAEKIKTSELIELSEQETENQTNLLVEKISRGLEKQETETKKSLKKIENRLNLVEQKFNVNQANINPAPQTSAINTTEFNCWPPIDYVKQMNEISWSLYVISTSVRAISETFQEISPKIEDTKKIGEKKKKFIFF